MGVVVDMFTREVVPAAQESDAVAAFMDDHFGEFLTAVEAMGESQTEAEFFAWVHDLRRQMEQWPLPPMPSG